MELAPVFILFFILLVAYIFTTIATIRSKDRLEEIRLCRVVRVSASKHKYGIPLRIYPDGTPRVNVVFPILENKSWFSEEKIVKLVKFTYFLFEVKTISSSDRDDVCIRYLQEAYPLVQTYFDTDPEIAKFKEKREDLAKIIKLVSTSNVYAGRVETYTKALADLDIAVTRALKLKNDCLNLIKEILIGAEVAKLDKNGYSEGDAAIEFKIQQIKRDFDDFKADAEARIEAIAEVLKLSEGVLS